MDKERLDSKIRLLLNITARLPGRRVRQQRPEPAVGAPPQRYGEDYRFLQ